MNGCFPLFVCQGQMEAFFCVMLVLVADQCAQIFSVFVIVFTGFGFFGQSISIHLCNLPNAAQSNF